MNDQDRLEILGGKAAGERVALDPTRANLVGTSRSAAVRLLDKGVFFKHATLEPTGAGWVVLEGLASARITVNGEPLAPGKGRLLVDGDVLAFADVEARFRAGAARPSAADPADPGPDAELVRLREQRRALGDELVTLVQRLHAGELGRLRHELDQAREERDAAQRRAAALDDALRDLVLRHNDQEQAYDVVYRAKLASFSDPGPELRLALEAEARRAGLDGEKRRLEDEVAALRREGAAQEAAYLARLEALRRRLAELEASQAEAVAQLTRAQEDLREAELDLRDARERLARPT